ncbi:MAG: response regulator transcription factor [Deltaproteobacteria bacterium]|nr:response regulator transcription factor [Deltaproteobacteria bacterium]
MMGKNISILLMEDNENDALLLVREIERYGYTPQWSRFETAHEMRAALGRQSWDLIIADYCLPQFSAPAALQLMKEMERDIPFIVVSGVVDEKVAVETMLAGAHDIIMKNNLTRLVAVIEREIREASIRSAKKQADEEIKRKSKIIEESDITLKNVLRHIEEDKLSMKDKITLNIDNNIKPIIRELKSQKFSDQRLIRRLEKNIETVDNVFYKKMTGLKLKLTPTEIKICNLIKSGHLAKEIADMLNLAYTTVTHYKKQIRKKLGLQNTAINLVTYLNEIANT